MITKPAHMRLIEYLIEWKRASTWELIAELNISKRYLSSAVKEARRILTQTDRTIEVLPCRIDNEAIYYIAEIQA